MKISVRSRACEGVDGRAAGIARGGADDGGALAAFGKRIVHQAGEKLHRHVLEGERGAVEKFQHEGVRAGLRQRHDGRMAEGRIGVVDHRLELVCRNLAAGETIENLEGDVLIGLAAQVADFLLRHGRPFARNVKSAVTAKARQKRVAKPSEGAAPLVDTYSTR